MRHRHQRRQYRASSGHSHPIAPRVPEIDMAPSYMANHSRRQWGGGGGSGSGQGYNDGSYHDGSSKSVHQAKSSTPDDGQYHANQQDSSTQDSTSQSSAQQASQQGQQSQQGAPGQGSSSSGTTANGGAEQGTSGQGSSSGSTANSGAQQGSQQGTSGQGSSSGSTANSGAQQGSQQGTSGQGSSSGSTANSGSQQGSQQGTSGQGSSGSTSNQGSSSGGGSQSGGQQANQQGQQSQQGSSGQGSYSSGSTANSGTQQASQQGQQNNAGQSAQGETANSGSSNSNQQAVSQQQASSGSSNSQTNQSPQNQQESQSNPGSLAGSVLAPQNIPGGYHMNAMNAANQNESPNMLNHDIPPSHQYIPDMPTSRKPNLPTTSPTTTSTTSPTASPTTSSTASPTSSPGSDSHGMTGAQKACAGLGVVLGLLLIIGGFIAWVYKKRRDQQRELSRSETLPDVFQTNASTRSKPRPAEKVRDAFYNSTASSKQSAHRKGNAVRNSFCSTKQRASSMYASFIGTAAGTGAGALGAARNSLIGRMPHLQPAASRKPSTQEHPAYAAHPAHQANNQSFESHGSERSPTEKGDGNFSTPTLVVSPTEENTTREITSRNTTIPENTTGENISRENTSREQTPTVRQVPSGRPQMERSASLENDADQAERTAELSPGNPPANSPRGQNLLAITSMVPHLSSQYRVEIAFRAKKPGHLELREGQRVTIRHSYDDGWVLCAGNDGHEGLAPRACLSSWPTKTQSQSSNEESDSPDSLSAPGTPRFYSHFFSTRSVT